MNKIVVDRSKTEAAVAIGVAWIAFLMALPVFEPDSRSLFGMMVGAAIAAALIIVGFAAASRVRPMSKRSTSEGLRLLGWSLSLGVLAKTTWSATSAR